MNNFERNHFIISRYSWCIFTIIVFISMEYVEAFFIQPITCRSSCLYIQTSNKAGKLQQRPFIETIKDGLFPTIGVNDDIEEKTEEDYQREVLEKV